MFAFSKIELSEIFSSNCRMAQKKKKKKKFIFLRCAKKRSVARSKLYPVSFVLFCFLFSACVVNLEKKNCKIERHEDELFFRGEKKKITKSSTRFLRA